MLRKRTIHKHHKVSHSNRQVIFFPLVTIVSIILLIDGFLRIFFSIALFQMGYESMTKLYYYLGPSMLPVEQGIKIGKMISIRWFLIGGFEVLCAYGLLQMRKWALYGIGILSFVRIYTIFAFPAQGIIVPLHQNIIFYLTKIIVLVNVAYLFTKRNAFK